VISPNVGAATRWGLNGLILLSLSVALYLGRSIFIPTVIALLLACMLWPAVRWLHQRGIPLVTVRLSPSFPWLQPMRWRLGIPWPIACGVAVGILVVLVMTTTLAFSLAIPRFLQSLPSDPDKAQEYYQTFRHRVARISPFPLDEHYLPEEADKSALVAYLRSALDPKNPQLVIETLKNLLGFGGYWLWQSILIMFTLFFFLLEGRMLSRRIVEVFGTSPEVQARVVVALQDMGVQVRTFLVWRTIVNLAMAVILGLIYYIVGLNQAGTWAMLTAVLLYVPYLGTILAGLPPIVDAFLTCESPWVAVWLGVFYMGVTTVEGYFIVPLVMGRSMDLNATTVMLSCLYWELVWGPAGLFLAMPVMAGAKTICYHVPEWRAWANLMDVRDGPPEERAEDPLETQLLPAASVEVVNTEVLSEPHAR
jgi:predicted PurR-regulated permease PerM